MLSHSIAKICGLEIVTRSLGWITILSFAVPRGLVACCKIPRGSVFILLARLALAQFSSIEANWLTATSLP